jgi:peptide/nickel transport system permease protein
MGAYAIRRLLWIPITVILVSMIVFLLLRFIPGTIVDVIVAEMQQAPGNTEAIRHSVQVALGLDKPLFVQYGIWVKNIVVHGSLGKSLIGGQDVTQMLIHRLPVTFELGTMSVIISVLFSIPIGVYAAIRQDSITDYILRSATILLIAIPSFWIGTMIMIYPSVWWGWSPPMQLIPFTKDPIGNLGMFILPALVLGTNMTGASMRMTRTMVLEVLRQDYIRTGWAKGLNERVIVFRHTLKNALIPVITIIGMQLPVLIGGSVIIEQIFNLPGMGSLLLSAISTRDYTVVSGATFIIGTFVIVINFAIDISYGWLDPRIHYQ